MKNRIWYRSLALGVTAAALLLSTTALASTQPFTMSGAPGNANIQGTFSGTNPTFAHPYTTSNVNTTYVVAGLQTCASYDDYKGCSVIVTSNFQNAKQSGPNLSCYATDIIAGNGVYNDPTYGQGSITGSASMVC